MAEHVEAAAKRAASIVQKLTGPENQLPKGSEAMPVTEIEACKGLAFTFVKKAGLGLTVEGGDGFVVAKLADGSWSAPLFITLKSLGIGFTLGYSEIESIIVLDTPEAVQAFASTQVTLDTDVGGALAGLGGAHLPITDANFTNLKLSDKTFTYSIASGVIADVSFQGMGYAVDKKTNTAVFGAEATPQAILSGSVNSPPAMQQLYTALAEAVKK